MGKPVEKLDYEKRYQSGRWNLVLLSALTVINIFIVLFVGDNYYIAAASVPLYLVSLGRILCGKMPNEFYVGKWANVEFMDDYFLFIMIAVAVVIIGIYVLLWFLSKKHVAFLIAGLVLVVIDTVFMFFVYDFSFNVLMDYAIHALMIIMMIMGIHSGFKLKKIRADEEAFMAAVNKTNRDMFNRR